MDAHPFSRVFHEAFFLFFFFFVAVSCCLLQSEKLCGMSHGLLLGELERRLRARGGEARVGVHGLSGWVLLVRVLRQERDGRVGWGGLRLGEVFHVADALVAHILSRVQQLFWTPPRVLRKGGETQEEDRG